MAIEFKLPDIGEGIAEGEIVKWLVQAGDPVEEHQPVVEVMTDKATVELPAPAAGRITEVLAAEGDVVPVGQVIFKLETDGAAGGAGEKGERGKGAAEPARAPEPAGEEEEAEEEEAEDEEGEEEEAEEEEAEEEEGGAAEETRAPRAREERAAAPPRSGGGRKLEFKLPDIGEGIAEGEIVKWLAGEGDSVEEHQPVVEVMTDKATVELPAPAAGRITKLLFGEGDVVPVGQVIFHLETGEAAGAAEPSAPAAAAPSDKGKAAPPRKKESAAPAREETPAARKTATAPARPRAAGEKVLAVPSARRVARELGIDLAEVPGTGRNGVVRRADVEAFAEAGAAAETAAPAEGPAEGVREPARAAPSAPPVRPSPAADRSEERIPFRGMRRKIAEAMSRSMFTAPHFTVVEEVDATELVELRAKAKALGEAAGVRVTYMPFIMKATALGLARFPMLNGRLDVEANEIVRPSYADIGVATDTQNGLIVPVIRDVQSKGILQLAAELNELAERTRSGRVRPEELRDSTFSITNAGNIGGTLATPIINFPDIAILGVHRIRKAPGVVETPQGDRIEVRQYMNLSLSVDHRLADGADGARMLVYMKQLLESPGLLAL